MLICPKCGSDNPLGRVFCVGCGGRLDLQALNREELTRRLATRRWKRYLPVAGTLVAVWLAVLVLLAAWPKSGPLGKPGTKPAGVRVEDKLRALAGVGKDQKMGIEFTESDFNGYLEYVKRPSLDVQSVSVAFSPSSVTLRVVRPLFSLDIKGFRWTPILSRDVVYQPSSGGLYPRTVTFGHLPLHGPARISAVRSLYRLAASQREWQTLAPLVTDVQAGEGTLTIVVSGRP